MQKNPINFEFYYNRYNSGNPGCLNKENFGGYITRASREVENFCKLPSQEHPDFELVRMCLCEVAEELFCADNVGSIKSETVDGYSVTYSGREEASVRIRNIVLKCLRDTNLIFAGVE